MKKSWNEKTTIEKVLVIMRIFISIIVMGAAIIQLLGVWDKAINIAVPLLGILMIVQAIPEWKTNRSVAILSICSAIFIFVCSFVSFFMK